MFGLDFLLHWATRELKTGHCSAATAVWLMRELVQDTLWLLQIGTVETWQQKCYELHTHFIFQPPQHQNHRQNIPPWEGCCPGALHILSALQPAKCYFWAPGIVANIQRPCWLHYADLTNVCHRLKSQMKHVWSIVILENIIYIQMHRKFKGHEKCWRSGCLQLEALALESLVTNWFWEGSR